MSQGLTFVIYSAQPDDLAGLQAALAADVRAHVLKACVEMGQAGADIKRLSPSAAIVTLGEAPDAAFSFIERVADECPETVIICASRNSSPDVILRSLRSGAREFLRLPPDAGEFRTVLNRTAEFAARQVKAQKRRGRITAVFSSKGGAGVSFVATNLAAAMAGRTLLVDLNLQGGDLDLYLGLESKFSIVDLVESRHRLDDTLLTGYLAPHSSSLALLAAPREASSAEDLRPEDVTYMLRLLSEGHDHIVIDTPHTFDAITLASLDLADSVLFVLPVDVASLRSAQRSLEIFERLGYPPHKVRVAVNRWSKQSEISLSQIQRYLGEDIIGFIPSDYRAAVSSINLGQPLLELQPSSGIAAEIKRIAAGVSGAAKGLDDARPRNSVLKSIFRRNSAPEPRDLGRTLNLSQTLDKV